MSEEPPPAPTASTVGPCPTITQISRTPRHWKFTQHLRTTRPPPLSEFENMNLDLDNIAEFKVPDVPPWTFSQPRVLFLLHNDKKSQTDPLVFRTKYHELLSNFPSYETIFTDGSKDGDTAGSACVTPSDTYKCPLPDNASIFSAEIKAIGLALNHIEQSRSTDFVIFSDSLSVLQSLHNRHIENPLFWMSF